VKGIWAKIARWLTEVRDYLQAFGAFGLFGIALLDSAFVPLPGGPDAVMLVLSGREPSMMPLYALSATLGSTIGCVILYYISRRAGRRALERFSEQKQARVKGWVERYDVLSVLVASLLPPPFPFKLFVVTAGVFRLNVVRFALAVAAGRAARFFLEGWVAVTYGERAQQFLADNFAWIGLALVAVVIAVFLLRGLARKRSAEAEG
jgi:membrane protein YqaA with SNARE-associated domain